MNPQETAQSIVLEADRSADAAEREYARAVRELYYATTTGHGGRPLGEVAAMHKKATDALANWRKAQIQKQNAAAALAAINYADE